MPKNFLSVGMQVDHERAGGERTVLALSNVEREERGLCFAVPMSMLRD
jgi:hypothetical protein